jgi:hypothetical protein
MRLSEFLLKLLGWRKKGGRKEELLTLEMWTNGRLVFGLYGGGGAFVSGDERTLRAAREKLDEACRKIDNLTNKKPGG